MDSKGKAITIREGSRENAELKLIPSRGWPARERHRASLQPLMEFFRRAPVTVQSLGILPGTFNPPTLAHIALAWAALARVDEVLFVLPRAFPHKTYDGAGLEERLAMLQAAVEDQPRYSVAASDQGCSSRSRGNAARRTATVPAWPSSAERMPPSASLTGHTRAARSRTCCMPSNCW